MPFNGSGVFSIINTFVGGTTILSSQVNQNYTDIATGLSTAILKDGTQAITATIPFSLSSTVAVPVQMVSTNADANAGPILELYRDSASPADGDIGGAIYFYGEDSSGTKTLFGAIRAVLSDITDTTEDGSLEAAVVVGGSLQTYAPIYSGAGRSSFSAHKNGSDQAVATTSPTKVTFGTEVFDVGTNFASSTWTPPAGTADIKANVLLSGVASATAQMYIYKNGASFKDTTFITPASGIVSLYLAITDQCNGTDTYEVYVATGDSSYTITGLATSTWFMGAMI